MRGFYIKITRTPITQTHNYCGAIEPDTERCRTEVTETVGMETEVAVKIGRWEKIWRREEGL
jgi:hypothetical protein